MNKKILIVSIIAVFLLVAISLSTAVSSNTVNTIKKKESPLFGIRTRRAVKERVGEVIENIKAKYIGERVFFLPFQFMLSKWQNYQYTLEDPDCVTELNIITCWYGKTCYHVC